jgi:pyrroloquinoline quinone biosynthesis protein D
MNAFSDKPKLSRLFRLQWEEAQNNYVLLYPEGMVKLNQSAAEILKRCDGERDIAAIVSDLESAFSASGLQADVEDFLRIANERGWIA